jgi:murein L,D-transpeptidase YafK
MLKTRVTLDEFLSTQKNEIIKKVSRTLQMKEALISKYFDREIERVKKDLADSRKAVKVFGVLAIKSSENVVFEAGVDEVNLQLETVFKLKLNKQGLKELLPNTKKVTMERFPCE